MHGGSDVGRCFSGESHCWGAFWKRDIGVQARVSPRAGPLDLMCFDILHGLRFVFGPGHMSLTVSFLTCCQGMQVQVSLWELMLCSC